MLIPCRQLRRSPQFGCSVQAMRPCPTSYSHTPVYFCITASSIHILLSVCVRKVMVRESRQVRTISTEMPPCTVISQLSAVDAGDSSEADLAGCVGTPAPSSSNVVAKAAVAPPEDAVARSCASGQVSPRPLMPRSDSVIPPGSGVFSSAAIIVAVSATGGAGVSAHDTPYTCPVCREKFNRWSVCEMHFNSKPDCKKIHT